MKVYSQTYRQRMRGYTKDSSVASHGAAKTARVDLGLALLQRLAIPGVRYSLDEIAAFAGCAESTIFQIERSALKKLRNRLRFIKDPRLVEMVAGVFEQREVARAKEVL